MEEIDHSSQLNAKNFFHLILCVTFVVRPGNISIHVGIHFFYRQLDFQSQPGVANEILENEPKSCLTVA